VKNQSPKKNIQKKINSHIGAEKWTKNPDLEIFKKTKILEKKMFKKNLQIYNFFQDIIFVYFCINDL